MTTEKKKVQYRRFSGSKEALITAETFRYSEKAMTSHKGHLLWKCDGSSCRRCKRRVCVAA